MVLWIDAHVRLHVLAPGWILTPPEYYEREVRLILDSTTRILAEDTTKTLRFNWAETAWLPMWLADDVNGTKRALLRQLTEDGMLEVGCAGYPRRSSPRRTVSRAAHWLVWRAAPAVHRGWLGAERRSCQRVRQRHQPDDCGAPVPPQRSRHRRVARTSCWVADRPFGASAATPRLFAEMGFSSHVIDRIPLRTHLELMATQQLEFT